MSRQVTTLEFHSTRTPHPTPPLLLAATPLPIITAPPYPFQILPGGGAVALSGGVKADFRDSTFARTSVTNGNGGAVLLASDFATEDANRSSAEFTQCSFEDFEAGFYGLAAYSSISRLRLVDSYIAAPDGASHATGTVFDFGVASNCQSGCGPGHFGNCSQV